jgi:Xaa-Pro aminopeptidase
MSDRLDRCRVLLESVGVDGVVVTDPVDVRYLSNFRGEDATLIVTPETALICTDARYWEQVHAEVTEFALFKSNDELMTGTVAAIAECLGPEAAIGFQGRAVSYADYRTLRRGHRGHLRDLRSRVSRLRVVKSASEMTLMRRAAEVTDAGVAAVVGRGLTGRSEADVAWDLRAEYHRLGAEGEGFPAIVACGDHGAQAHALPSTRVIATGELVVIDTGARVDGYCSDITRTFAAGEPAPEARAIYDLVLEAQLAGLAATRAGAHGRTDVDAACRNVITAAGYGDAFGHGTGHGVGLAIHEEPTLGRVRGDRLEAGMVCTVEPGIYIEGSLGVRIEDTVLVTEQGCERLTKYPKELQVIA